MSSDLAYDQGVDVSLIFSGANPAASATTALTLPQSNAGFVVPTGYKFHAICLSAASNADLTAGTATLVVRATPAGGAAATVGNGPTVVLADTAQNGVGTAKVGAATVAAGSTVGVAIVTDASYAPATADIDVVLVGKLLPA